MNDLRNKAAAAIFILAISFGILPLGVSAAPTDCIDQSADGKAVCSKPQPNAWSHALCGEHGTFTFYDITWCAVRGGTWQNGSCTGFTPDDESNLFPRALDFMRRNYGTQACSGTDTGWGQSVTSNLCWSGSPTYQSGVLVSDLRRIRIQCGANSWPGFVALRIRSTSCPPGTQSRLVNSQIVCAHPVEASCPVGNPVLPGSGLKLQHDTDFSFEGFDFRRAYSPRGQLIAAASATPAPAGLDSVWRHEFDARLYPLPNGTGARVAVAWSDHTVQYFRDDGAAVLATRDTSARMVAVNGGYLVRRDSWAYEFAASGPLMSMTNASGQRFTLRYADGTVGPNGDIAVDFAGQPTTAPVPVGHLIEVASSTGRTLRLRRDTAGKLVVSILAGQIETKYSYDAQGRLALATYADGSFRQYHYNEPTLTAGANLPNALTGISIGQGQEVPVRFALFGFNSAGQAVSTEHAGGADRHTFTIAANGTTAVGLPTGQTSTHTFTTFLGVQKPRSQTQPAGSGCLASDSRLEYDAAGNVSSRDDFNGNRACYGYDSTRRLQNVRVEGLPNTNACSAVTVANAVLPPGARKVETSWHPDWALQTRVAEASRITTYVHNGQPDPYASGALAQCAPTTSSTADGKPIPVLCRKVEQATQDTSGAQGFAAAPEVGAALRQWQWTYDADGRKLTEDGPLPGAADTTTWTYFTDTSFASDDPTATGHTRGDLASITTPATANQPQGLRSQFTLYDRAGNLKERVDANGVSTLYRYDNRLRLTASITVGQTTSYEYWLSGELKKTTMADGSWLYYEYDAAQRLYRVSDELLNSVTYTLDASGVRTLEEYKIPPLSCDANCGGCQMRWPASSGQKADNLLRLRSKRPAG
jgi:YD repeat-containing protein